MKKRIQFISLAVVSLFSSVAMAVNDGGTGNPTVEKTISDMWNWLISWWMF